MVFGFLHFYIFLYAAFCRMQKKYDFFENGTVHFRIYKPPSGSKPLGGWATVRIYIQNLKGLYIFVIIYMQIKIFTIPFSEETEGFDTTDIEEFCFNKKVISQQSHFFVKGGQPYWTVLVWYDIVVEKSRPELTLENEEHQLYQTLKQWRKNKAQKLGFPVYLIATNAQLVEIIKQKAVTKSALENIKGFGKQKVNKYSDDIIQIIKRFYNNGKGK